MLQEAMRTIGFFCPHCRQAVIVERSVFQLAASKSEVLCPCGKSGLRIDLQGGKLGLHTPCLFCDQDHSLSCSTHAFLHESIMAFSCGATNLDCCYVGEKQKVFHAMERLEETVDELEQSVASQGNFFNDLVMKEILEELLELTQDGKVACSCGCKDFGVLLSFSAVELCCSACQSTLKIPAATVSDLEDLCCKTTLTIRKKK